MTEHEKPQSDVFGIKAELMSDAQHAEIARTIEELEQLANSLNIDLGDITAKTRDGSSIDDVIATQEEALTSLRHEHWEQKQPLVDDIVTRQENLVNFLKHVRSSLMYTGEDQQG